MPLINNLNTIIANKENKIRFTIPPYVNYQTGQSTILPSIFDFYNVLIEVIALKNLVKDSVQGKDFTIKEYIAIDDYEIIFNIVLSSSDITINNPIGFNNNVYPLTLLNNINQIFAVDVPISVSSLFLQEFEITSVIPYRLQITQEQGSCNQQSLILRTYSNVPASVTTFENLSIWQ